CTNPHRAVRRDLHFDQAVLPAYVVAVVGYECEDLFDGAVDNLTNFYGNHFGASLLFFLLCLRIEAALTGNSRLHLRHARLLRPGSFLPHSNAQQQVREAQDADRVVVGTPAQGKGRQQYDEWIDAADKGSERVPAPPEPGHEHCYPQTEHS